MHDRHNKAKDKALIKVFFQLIVRVDLSGVSKTGEDVNQGLVVEQKNFTQVFLSE